MYRESGVASEEDSLELEPVDLQVVDTVDRVLLISDRDSNYEIHYNTGTVRVTGSNCKVALFENYGRVHVHGKNNRVRIKADFSEGKIQALGRHNSVEVVARFPRPKAPLSLAPYLKSSFKLLPVPTQPFNSTHKINRILNCRPVAKRLPMLPAAARVQNQSGRIPLTQLISSYLFRNPLLRVQVAQKIPQVFSGPINQHQNIFQTGSAVERKPFRIVRRPELLYDLFTAGDPQTRRALYCHSSNVSVASNLQHKRPCSTRLGPASLAKHQTQKSQEMLKS